MMTPPAPAATAAACLPPLVRWFEHLSPATLEALPTLYHPSVRFIDPFNDLHGTAAVQQLFAHMLDGLEQPRFVVLTQLAQGDEAFLTWDFHFAWRGRPLRIHGASHMRFAPDGRVIWHRDYWDAAEQVLAHLPLLGRAVRWVQRRLRAPSAPAQRRHQG